MVVHLLAPVGLVEKKAPEQLNLLGGNLMVFQNLGHWNSEKICLDLSRIEILTAFFFLDII